MTGSCMDGKSIRNQSPYDRGHDGLVSKKRTSKTPESCWNTDHCM